MRTFLNSIWVVLYRSPTMPSFHLVIYILIYCQLSEGLLSVKKEDYVEAFKPVMIGDTTYSMVELPGSETKIVEDERGKLLGHIDLRSLVQDMGHVGRFINLATHGMAAAGPDSEYVELELEVQRLGYDVTRLCAKSADTVTRFRSETTTILIDLEPTYEYLLDGYEDQALETLSSVPDIAGRFAEAAKELHSSFNEETLKVAQILEKTRETEADREYYARQREVDKKYQQIINEREKKQYMKIQEELEKAEQSFFDSELKESDAIVNLNDKKEGSLYRKVYGILGIASIEQSQESKERQLEEFKKRKVDARKTMMEKEEKGEQTYQNMNNAFDEVEYYEREVNLAKSSAEALHEAREGLKTLTATMMQAAFFWKRMQDYCKLLSDSKLKDTVEKEMDEHSDERQIKSLILMPFKKKVVHFNAGWVALDGVCDEYMGSIKETQKELYKYIRENPTQEEAKKTIRSLAANFQKDPQDKKTCIKEGSECSRR